MTGCLRRSSLRPAADRIGRFALVLLVLSAADAGAQEPDFEDATQMFGRLWTEAKTDSIGGVLASAGVSLHLPGESHPTLSVRLARAALAGLHQRTGRGPVETVQARVVGGEPRRGFLEMSWHPLPEGMTEPLSYTVFVAYELVESGWRVVQIRVLEPGASAPPAAPPRP